MFACFLNGILLYSKSLPYESALRIAEKFEGGKLWAPQKLKKIIFLRFLGAHNSPPSNFSAILRALL